MYTIREFDLCRTQNLIKHLDMLLEESDSSDLT